MVAYLAHGVRIDNVDISEVLGRSGVWAGGTDTDGLVEDESLQMIVTLAAPVTNRKRFGTYFLGDVNDLDAARKDAERLSPKNIDAFMDEMLKEARRFVYDPVNWAAIQRIAHKLVAKVEKAIEEEQYPRQVKVRGAELREWYDEK